MKTNQPIQSFVQFIQKKYQKANYRIDSVWVRGADLASEHLQGGNYNDVDFSECNFDDATFEKCSFARVNFSFLKVKNLTCQEVIFDQADFSYAHFTKVVFDKKVSYIDAQWVGATLDGLTISDTSIAELQQTQQRQAKENAQIRDELLKLHTEIEAAEKAVYAKYQTLEGKFQDQDETLKQLAEEICQAKLNLQTHKDNLEFDKHLYKIRHLIENLFARLKHLRSIATRFEKLARNFKAMVYIACTFIWLKLK